MLFLLLISLPISSIAFLFPSTSDSCCSSSCSCPSIPACPPIPRCPQPIPVTPCCSTCTSCKKRTKREIEFISNSTYIVNDDVKLNKALQNEEKRHRRDALDDIVHVDAKCNSEHLREIIIQNIDRVTSIAKKKIQEQAETQLQGRFNVICARGDFSYITNTEIFCQQTVGDVTCYVFKQLSSVVRKRLS